LKSKYCLRVVHSSILIIKEVSCINKNVTIVVVILVFVVIAGYIVWVKSNYEGSASSVSDKEIKEELMQSSESAKPATDSGLLASESASESSKSSNGAEE
jgi:uncharacterized protein YxeA